MSQGKVDRIVPADLFPGSVTIYFRDGVDLGWAEATRTEQEIKLPLYLTYFRDDRHVFSVGVDYDELFLAITGVDPVVPPLMPQDLETVPLPDGGTGFTFEIDPRYVQPFCRLHIADVRVKYSGTEAAADSLLVIPRILPEVLDSGSLGEDAFGALTNVGSTVGGIRFLPAYFVRGNADSSVSVLGKDRVNLKGDMQDAMLILRSIFLESEPIPCADAADTNDNGTLEVTDAILLLNHLYRGGPAPLPPNVDPGLDSQPEDGLDCAKPVPFSRVIQDVR
jgi:hypothetical protein